MSTSLFSFWNVRQTSGRLLVAILFGGITFVFLPAPFPWSVRAVAGWDTLSLVMNVLAWFIIARASASETQRRAADYDPGRTSIWLIALIASLFSLFAATFVLRHGNPFPPAVAGWANALAIGAVILSWVLTHTAYTLRYAHLYYRDQEHHGGLDFPGKQPPCDFDFAYFSFTIGMCFQVSDVAVSSSLVRRTVLAHSLLSFVYNTTILALALNLLFGHIA